MARTLLHVLIVGMLAAVALAGTPANPELSDPCGDSHTSVHSGDEAVTVPPTRHDHEDLRAAWVEQDVTRDGVVEAVHVHLEVCGDLPPEQDGWSAYAVRWRFEDGCRLRVGADSVLHVADGSAAEYRKTATFRKTCPEEGSIPGQTVSEVVFDVSVADAVEVDGPRMTWSLSPDELPAAAAALRPGTVWPDTSARVGRYRGGTILPESNALTVKVNPTIDYGFGGRDVVIGGG